MENKRGLWLCIEGADYTGKRTQCSLLFDRLTRLSEDNIIIYTHEPTKRAKEIKRKLKEEKGEAYKDGLKMAELYIADRIWNENNIIKPILEYGGIVISNRHKYSTDAYQSSQGIDLEILMNSQKKAGVGTPDITCILDISMEERKKRMFASGKEPDKFESDLFFQERVSEMYRKLEKIQLTEKKYFGNIYLIDANSEPEKVFERVWEKIEPLYNKWIEDNSCLLSNI